MGWVRLGSSKFDSSPILPCSNASRPVVFPLKGPNRANVDFQDLLRLDEQEFLNDNLIAFFLRYVIYADQIAPYLLQIDIVKNNIQILPLKCIPSIPIFTKL